MEFDEEAVLTEKGDCKGVAFNRVKVEGGLDGGMDCSEVLIEIWGREAERKGFVVDRKRGAGGKWMEVEGWRAGEDRQQRINLLETCENRSAFVSGFA